MASGIRRRWARWTSRWSLSHLATRRLVSFSTQNQALSALLFLYREVLATPVDRLEGVVRA
jgi:hypothetical protein